MYTKLLFKLQFPILALWLSILIGFLGVVGHRLLYADNIADNSMGVWFLEDDPDIQQYEEFLHAFDEKEWTILLLETENIYDKKFLNELSDVSYKIEQLDNIVKVISIANTKDNLLTADGSLLYSRLYTPDSTHSWQQSSAEENFKKALAHNPIFHQGLINTNDSAHTAIMIQTKDRLLDASGYRREMIQGIESIVDSMESIEQWAIVGMMPLIVEMNRAAVRDVIIFYIAIYILVTVFGLLTFRSIRDLIVLYAVVLSTLVPTMGLLALLKIPYNMVTQIMPTLLAGIAIANVVHFIKEFHEARHQLGADAAVTRALTLLWRPGLWASLTTIVGFSSYMISAVPPIRHLGFFGSIGIFSAWAFSLIIAPILLKLLYPDGRAQDKEAPLLGHSRWHALPQWIHKQKRHTIGIFILCCFSLLGLSQLRVDTNYVNWFDEGTRFNQAHDWIQDAGYSTSSLNVVVKLPHHTSFNDYQHFNRLVTLNEAIAQLQNVNKVISADDFLFQIDQAFLQEDSNLDKFRNYSPQELNGLLQLAEFSDNTDLSDYLSQDKRYVHFLVLTDYMSAVQIQSLREQINNLHQRLFKDDSELFISGSAMMLSNMNTEIGNTQIQTLSIVIFCLIVVMPMLFRSLPLALLGIALNLFPLVFTYSLMSWFGVTINIATVLIGGVSLSIVVDDTVHFLTRFRIYLNEGLEWQQAIDKTIATIGHSISMTTFILVGAFSCMALSSFLPTSAFGIFISITLILAWAIDLFLIPVILTSYGKFKLASRPNIEVAKN